MKRILDIVNNKLKNSFNLNDQDLARCSVSEPVAKFVDRYDISLNHAMVLSKKIDKSPIEIFEFIKTEIKNSTVGNFITEIDFIAGFINISVAPEFWHDVAILAYKNSSFFFADHGNGEKVNIEYVSANPTGPMHIGHARGAVYGDILANILAKSGFDVTREYYINDAGSQIQTVLKSLRFRVAQVLAKDFSESIPAGCYPGDYLIDAANKMIDKFGANILDKWDTMYNEIYDFTIQSMMDIIKIDLARLGVFHDVFSSEKKLSDSGCVAESFDDLKSRDLIYKGTIEKPKGGSDDRDWEMNEQFLFRSSNFGDDSDRAVMKSDGSWAYFMPDIAYHYDKFKRGFNNMILVLGSDHKGYKKRISAAVAAISEGRAKINVILAEIVNFVKNGEPVKMSKRAGNFLTLADVLDEIDPQILRFFLITKKNDTVVDFDFAKVLEQSKDNPIFYIQYANTRITSILNKINDSGFDIDNCDIKNIASINHTKQCKILAKISQLPNLIEYICKHHEPHLLCNALLDISSLFHSLYSDNDFKFVTNDKSQLSANVIFLKIVQGLIHACLDAFGIKSMEKM
jgi:arginyl-tRNA synthetase